MSRAATVTVRGRMAWAIAAAATGTILLGGCAGLGQAGAAATVSGNQISTEQLSSTVDAVQEQRGQAPGEPDSQLVTSVLQRLIVTDLVAEAAAAQNVSVSQGDVDAALAGLEAQLGGREGLVQAYLDAGVPADQIEEQTRLSLEVQALGAALVPDADAAGQQQAVVQYVTGFGLQAGIEVSPRFGTWDPLTLQLGPQPVDLAAPVLPTLPTP